MCPPRRFTRHARRSTPARTHGAVGLTALTTDHGSPRARRFRCTPGCGRCHHFPDRGEGRATADVDSFARIEDWWRTVDDAFLQIDDDQARLARDTEKGCTRRVAEFYGPSEAFVAWLQIIRAFSLLFLYAGFLKILVVSRLRSHHARAVAQQRLRVVLAIVQTGFSGAAWFLVLRLSKSARRRAFVSDRGTRVVRGVVVRAFFSLCTSTAVPSLYLFIEACACVDERKRGSASGETPAAASKIARAN